MRESATFLLFIVILIPLSGSHLYAEMITVGLVESYYPFEYIGPDGSARGFNIDLINAVAANENINLNYKVLHWKEMLRALKDGRIDVHPGTGYTAGRDLFLDFSNHHSVVDHCIFTKNSSGIASITDLKNKKVAVISGSTIHNHLKLDFYKIRLSGSANSREALQTVASGRADAAIVPRLSGYHILKDLNLGNINTVGGSIRPYRSCFAVAENNETLLRRLNRGLNDIKLNGEYDKIYRKWFRITNENSFKYESLQLLLSAVLVVSAAMAALLIWRKTLQRSIDRKTFGLVREAAEHRKVELALIESRQKLLSSIQKREELLAEVHHRVKNNLQILISLTDLQQASSKCSDLFLTETQIRIQALSRTQDFLHGGQKIRELDFCQFLRELISEHYIDCGCPSPVFKIDTSAAELKLPADTMVLTSMLISESTRYYLRNRNANDGEETVQIGISKKYNGTELLIRSEYAGCKISGYAPPEIKPDDKNRSSARVCRLLASMMDAELSFELNSRGIFRLSLPAGGCNA